MKLYQAILALVVATFLCSNCNNDEPTPSPLLFDMEGTWQIRINDWHKHSAVERSGQDIYPGTIAFDAYRDTSGSGSIDYTVDGEQVVEPFTYQVLTDTLIIILSRLPDNKTATYEAKNITDTEIRLIGTTETVDPGTGLLEVLTEDMVVTR